MNDTIKYYYRDSSGQTRGSYNEEELKKLGLDANTPIWCKGQPDWVSYSTLFTANVIQKKSKAKFWICLSLVTIVLSLIVAIGVCHNKGTLYRLRANSYECAEFEMYLEKYYRDMEVFGIIKRKPLNTTIRLAPMQYFDDTKDYNGVCFGHGDDDRIEIYINEDVWNKLKRPQKYLLMYHELSHDILNVEDLSDSPCNYNKLMCPVMNRFERVTMDDFIEMAHEFFEEQATLITHC